MKFTNAGETTFKISSTAFVFPPPTRATLDVVVELKTAGISRPVTFKSKVECVTPFSRNQTHISNKSGELGNLTVTSSIHRTVEAD